MTTTEAKIQDFVLLLYTEVYLGSLLPIMYSIAEGWSFIKTQTFKIQPQVTFEKYINRTILIRRHVPLTEDA
jgi:hypothetical protein